jgi:hypothetical protein
MRTKIDCCYQCTRPWKDPYCHVPGNCPDYTGQRAELDESKADFLRKHNTASGIQQQRADGVARATRKRRL